MAVDLTLVKELRERTKLGLNACREALIKSSNDIELAIDLLKKSGELKAADVAGRIATEGKVIAFINGNKGVILEVNCQTDFVAKGDEFSSFVKELALSLTSNEVKDFEDSRKSLVAKTGENIVIRRQKLLEKSDNDILLSYVHQGDKIAVLLQLETLPTEEAIDFGDICAMQIAAMNPLAISPEDIPSDVSLKQKEIFMAQIEEDEKLKAKPLQAKENICLGKLNKWLKEVSLLEQECVISESKETMTSLLKKSGVKSIKKFIRFELGEGLDKKQSNLKDEVDQLLK